MSQLTTPQQVQEEESIDLLRLFRALWHRAWLLILAAVIGGALGYTATKLFVTPTYRTYFSSYVNNRKDTGESVNYVTSTDLSASRYLVLTYGSIITSRTVLEEAAKKAGLELTYAQLRGAVSTSIITNTEIINVYVVLPNPSDAQKLAQAISDVAPLQMNKIVEGSSMQIIDEASLPTSIYSPSYRKNALIGAMAFFLLVALVIVLRELLNTKVTTEEELESRFGIPVIGTIPDLAAATNHNGAYSYSSYGYGGAKGEE